MAVRCFSNARAGEHSATDWQVFHVIWFRQDLRTVGSADSICTFNRSGVGGKPSLVMSAQLPLGFLLILTSVSTPQRFEIIGLMSISPNHISMFLVGIWHKSLTPAEFLKCYCALNIHRNSTASLTCIIDILLIIVKCTELEAPTVLSI